MLLIKVLINAFAGFFIIALVYGFFYFEIIPRAIGQYKKMMTRRKTYDRDINNINSDN